MTASTFYNRVKYTPAAGGTADFVTSAAVTGFLTPATASVSNGAVVSYVAFSSDQSQWETGQGTYASGTTTLARTTVRESTNAGAKVNFSAAPTVALDFQAHDAMALAPLASPTFTGTVTVPTPFTIGAVSVTATGTQLNYLNAATGTTGTNTTNLVFSTSPTLITPVLGVAAATSLAINGATIGAYNLAMIGLFQIKNANQASQLYIQNGTSLGMSLNGDYPGFGLNAYYDNANWKAFAAGSTGAFQMDPTTGNWGFTTGNNPGAGNNATFTERMRLTNAGNLVFPATPYIGFGASFTADTTLSRQAAGVTQFGTATANAAGSWLATSAGLGPTPSLSASTMFNISAGTTAISQMRFGASTAPTSPIDGDFWFDGTNVKIRVSGATKTFTLT